MFMRTLIAILFLGWVVVPSDADGAPLPNRNAKPVGPEVEAALREASDLALMQDKVQHYWSDGVLLQIAGVQIRAGDFDGALRSIRGSSYDHGRNARLVDLAEALARAGKKERALEVVRMLDPSWRPNDVEDTVQLRWIEHLIAIDDLGRAAKATEQLKFDRNRLDGMRKLAVAYAKSGDADGATVQFTLALGAAADLKGEFDRARAYWETADAQLSVGKADAAKATLRRLVEKVEIKEPWAKVVALSECAALAAKAKDEQTAHLLFRRAVEAHNNVDALNKQIALQQIAVAQAGVGYIDDALKTASMIAHSETDFAQDGDREKALYAIAVAQVKANDAEGAVRTALSVKYFIQYRDDALHAVIDHEIAKQDLQKALTTAEKIDNPSRKASAILKVAAAYAKSGDRKTAADVGARIELTTRKEFRAQEKFDYRAPRSWCVRYDASSFFTISRSQMWGQRAAEVAGAAMSLSQELGQIPDDSYAILFDKVHTEEVIQSLARAHAVSGDAGEALAWAKKIGGSVKVKSIGDDISRRAVEQRIYALIGVAEGILDRSSKGAPKPEP
jgi:tetratricopeptide (TPR) repeat protein